MGIVKRVVFPLLVSIGLLPSTGKATTTTYAVTGQPGKQLSDAAGAIQSATSGTQIVEFSGYANVGTFALDGSGADSIIFQRKVPSTQALSFPSSVLFTFRNFKGIVLFKGLAFKPSDKTGILLDGALSIKSNKHLIFDSCQIYGDTVASTGFLSWIGSPGSKIQFRRTYLSFKAGGGSFDLVGDTVLFKNSIFNSQAGGSVHVTSFLSLQNNTFVRGQIFGEGQPPTSSIATVSIMGNLFFNPSSGHLGPLFLRGMGTVLLDSIKNNGKDPKYTKWDEGSYPTMFFSDRGNANFSGSFPDSSEMWNWALAGESLKGAYNPAGTNAMPSYTLYPGINTLKKRVGKDSVSLVLDNAEVPRMVDVTYGSATYPSDIDSLRTFYLKDTSLAISGPATLTSIELPGILTSGPAVLVGVNGSAFVSQTRNPTPNVPVFLSSSNATQFVPAFGGQNTKKGASITPTTVPVGKSLTFSSVQLSGVTSFFTTKVTPPGKRIRLLQKGSQMVSLAESTTVLASGNIAYGVNSSLDSGAWISDSVFFWVSGVGYRKPSLVGSQYTDTLPFRNPLEVVLAERLGIGVGKDTLVLASGDTLFSENADKGFQIASTSSAPSTSSFPFLANFSKGYSFTWLGRDANVNEVLKLKIKRTLPMQRGFVATGSKVDTATTVVDSDGLVFTLPVDGTGKTFFLGQRFSIGANVSKDTAFGQDSIKGLVSTTPGEIATDSTGLTSNGLPLASSRFLGGRKVIPTNLSIPGTYTFSFVGRAAFIPDSIHSYVLSGSNWTEVKTIRTGNRYSFALGAGQTEVAVLEGLPVFTPSKPPTVSVSASNLLVTPNLTVPEKDRVKTYTVELFSIGMDGKITRDTSKAFSVDSTARLTLGLDRIYAYRVSYQIISGTENPDSTWTTLDSRKLSAKIIQSLPELRTKLAWHLIGLPFNGTFSKNLKSGIQGIKDSTEYLLLDWTGVKRDTIAGSKEGKNPALQRGRGYFFASTEAYKTTVDSTDTLDLKSFTSKHDSEGWKVITDPFPFAYPLDQIKISGSPISNAMELIDTTRASGEIIYSWVKRDTLKAFQGYSLYVFGPSQLTFDPFPFKKSLLAKKASAQVDMIQVSAFNEDGFNRAYLVSGPNERSVPYMPVPSSSLMLNVGGNLFQAIPTFHEVDQEITLTAVRAGKVIFTAGMFRGVESLVYRLYDPRSGEFMDLSKNPEVGVNKGENSFRLIAGNTSYVSTKTASLVQSLPRIFSMDQNAPNPWVGSTQIRYVLPTGHGQILRGKLEIEDIKGRTLFTKNLDEVSVGSHSMLITEKGWKAGAYFYRMTIETDQNILRLQKRMIVTK